MGKIAERLEKIIYNSYLKKQVIAPQRQRARGWRGR